MTTKYQARVEKVFKNYRLEQYRETSSFIEFYAHLAKPTYAQESAFVDLKTLSKLARLVGTEKVSVTGFYMDEPKCCCADPTDHAIYVLVDRS